MRSGESRRPPDPDHTPHESPWTMTLPLVVLAGLAVVGGAINLPFTDSTKLLEHLARAGDRYPRAGLDGAGLVALAVVATLSGLVGIGIAVRRCTSAQGRPRPDRARRVRRRAGTSTRPTPGFMGGPGRKLFDAVAWFDTHDHRRRGQRCRRARRVEQRRAVADPDRTGAQLRHRHRRRARWPCCSYVVVG